MWVSVLSSPEVIKKGDMSKIKWRGATVVDSFILLSLSFLTDKRYFVSVHACELSLSLSFFSRGCLAEYVHWQTSCRRKQASEQWAARKTYQCANLSPSTFMICSCTHNLSKKKHVDLRRKSSLDNEDLKEEQKKQATIAVVLPVQFIPKEPR